MLQGSPEGKEINAAIKDSRIVPVRTTLRLLKHAMWAVGGDRFLVDGFPRAIDNAEAWEAELGEPEGVLYFHAPVEVLQQRLAGRSETSQRVDDNPDTIAKRFTTFEEVTFPVIKHYAKSGKVSGACLLPAARFLLSVFVCSCAFLCNAHYILAWAAGVAS